jgi:transposase
MAADHDNPCGARNGIRDADWDRIKPFFPEPKRAGRPPIDNRIVFDAILWTIRAGVPWRDLPAEFGHWQTIYGRWRKWTREKAFDLAFEKLSEDADMQDVSVDSTSVKAHKHAAGARKSSPGGDQCVGISRGGRNTKIHVAVDGLGNPVAFLPTRGNASDSATAIPLLEKIPDLSKSTVLADRAYVSKKIREYIEKRGGKWIVPPKSNMKIKWEYDKERYNERSQVECFFNKVKEFRRFATRYDKLIEVFAAVFVFASCMVLLR